MPLSARRRGRKTCVTLSQAPAVSITSAFAGATTMELSAELRLENQQTATDAAATAGAVEPAETGEDTFSVLGPCGEETSDVILEVEGKQLQANRAVLAHYSPVFRALFFSDFKERAQSVVPLPGKKYSDMVLFFKCMLPRGATDSDCFTGNDLLRLLTLADEYQVDEVKARCQSYIGEQLLKFHRTRNGFPKQNHGIAIQSQQSAYYASGSTRQQPAVAAPSVSRRISPLMFYLRLCTQFALPRFRAYTIELLVEEAVRLDDLMTEVNYPHVSNEGKVELLESFCCKVESKR